MKPTDISDPGYFHKVVDCQWACPAHTPVPEYIRLIAAGRYSDAYMVNRESNVFPGILGRTCDRPCEPACRRGRVEDKPVAICRLKRVAADLMPLGYEITIFEKLPVAGGLMRSNIPAFRLPESVLQEEIDMILRMGVEIRYSTPVESLKSLLEVGYDA